MTPIPAVASTASEFDARARPEGGPVVVVDVEGSLDRAALPPVAQRLEQALAARPEEVIVDLGDCPYVDATGLAVLVETHRRANRAGATLALARCSPRVLRLLSLTGLRRVFDVRS